MYQYTLYQVARDRVVYQLIFELDFIVDFFYLPGGNMCSSCRSYRSHPVKMHRSHRSRPHSGTHLSNIIDRADHTDFTDPGGHANQPINMDHPNPPINIYFTYTDHADRTDPVPVKMNRSYISHRFRLGRPCRSHTGTDHTDHVSAQLHTCKYLPHTDPIPVKHAVNKCEVSSLI